MIGLSGFHYNQEYSGNKNIKQISTAGGFLNESFLATVSNQVTKTKNSYKSYIAETDSEPIIIPMALYFEDNLDDENIRIIKRWLHQTDFKELVFEDQPEKVYYAKIDGSSKLSHNAIKSGYVEFNFLTNSAYSFSRLHEIEGEINSLNTFEHLVIYNEGDETVSPKLKFIIDPIDAKDIEIYNDTTGEYFLLQNNLVNESIVVWNEYNELETSSSLRHCYDDHNGEFVSLAEGVNELRIKGKFKYTIEYQAIYL